MDKMNLPIKIKIDVLESEIVIPQEEFIKIVENSIIKYLEKYSMRDMISLIKSKNNPSSRGLVLKFLRDNPKKKFSISDVSKSIGIGYSPIHKWINILKLEGVVVVNKDIRSGIKLFSIREKK